jgi:hypothetical protein
VSAGDNSNRNPRHEKSGAVWATGAALDRAARRPCLDSSDATVLITPHALATDLAARPYPPIISASYDATTTLFTVRVRAWIQYGNTSTGTVPGGQLTWTDQAYVFARPAAGATVWIEWIPNLHPYAVRWRSAIGAPATTTDADTLTMESHTAQGGQGPPRFVFGSVLLGADGVASVGRSARAYTAHIPAADIYAVPHATSMPGIPPAWHYDQAAGRLSWGSGGPYVDLTAGAHTIYASASAGNLVTILTADTPTPGLPYIVAGSITLNAELHPTVWSMAAVGWDATIASVGKLGGIDTTFIVSPWVYTVINGLIVDKVAE